MALFSWPFITFVIYQRMPVGRATMWSILGAYLLLPSATEVDLPLIPPLDKFTISNLSAFLICRYALGKRFQILPKLGFVKVLMLAYIISPFITALLNEEAVVAGPLYIKGMTLYDALSAVIRQTIFIMPFLLGLNFVRDAKNHEELFRILVISGLAYSLPMLFEVRMSPQLHGWIYGFFPHSFIQQKRLDGFRPVVFIGHGLLVAFFAMSSLAASITLGKLRKSILGFQPVVVVIYFAVTLLLCKSMASVLYALLLAALIQLTPPRMQTLIAKLIVILVISYPMLRALDLFPVTAVSDVAYSVNAERGQSLQYRFDNEDLLLARVQDRPLFGWGSWGRNRVFDLSSGKDLAVTDGRWIIVMGQFGWIGYIAEFGLLIIPIVRARRVVGNVEAKPERIMLASLSLLMAVSVLDLLPNSTVTPWTWLLAGALLGRVEQIRLLRRQKHTHADEVTDKPSLQAV